MRPTGIVSTMDVDHDHVQYIKHPYSGTIIPGFQIPFWDEAKKMVLQAALVLPNVRFIGWDVAIAKDRPLLIEGNSNPGADNMQMAGHKGLNKNALQYV